METNSCLHNFRAGKNGRMSWKIPGGGGNTKIGAFCETLRRVLHPQAGLRVAGRSEMVVERVGL